ncbi:MAG: KOW domain-containing RNA-binding protein [Firmicutes bacterium]|nr:KOW domain-containing RNA-binding protein [Bacillota bacterium]
MDKRTKTLLIPTLGQVTVSTMGHDRGRMYLVTKVIDGEFVEVCDGDYRKRENPKKKRFKHLVVIKEGIIPSDKIEKINDKEIYRALKMLEKGGGTT